VFFSFEKWQEELLKKWEEELKLKGKLINENDKDRTKLLSYVTKLENRNHMSYFYIFRLYKLELRTVSKSGNPGPGPVPKTRAQIRIFFITSLLRH
jgi:hypothetical protein